MTFELAEVDVSDIPDIDRLRSHLECVEAQTRGAQGHGRMATALEVASHDSIPVLRISDRGTRGLEGSESRETPTSPLSALTRGSGISSNESHRGGSFGIGSAVGPMASSMCTVLYTSMTAGDPAVVFAGYARLASHKDPDGIWRVGDGFFTDLGYEEDFRYLRNPRPLGPFAQRTEPGTDAYVLGYRMADTDPQLLNIRNAFISDFLLAIHRGSLIVEGVTPSGSWLLNSDTLGDVVKEVEGASSFYRALQDPKPAKKTSRRFGQLTLYVEVDDTLEKTLNTIAVRKPLMKIETFKHPSVHAKYAAILECSDEAGNAFLRKLETPTHKSWDPGRHLEGRAALDELKRFVREELRARVQSELGEQVEIKGLSRYLPQEMFDRKQDSDAAGATPRPGQGEEESSTVTGGEAETRPVINPERRSVPVRVQLPAVPGDEDADKGKDRGGAGHRKGHDTGLPGSGAPGEGKARIRAGAIRFRSWSDAATGDVVLALTSSLDVSGDLELVALGPGGATEDEYVLPITRAALETAGSATPITWSGNTLKGISLTPDVTSRIRVGFASTHRYRLGVK